jgi:hypothetical protein
MHKKSPKKKLRWYQLDFMKHIRDVKHFGALFDPRLGKTLPVIREIKKRFGRELPVLVLAPYSAWKGWKEQLEAEDIIPTFLLGTIPAKRESLLQPSGWHVVTYDTAWRDIGFLDSHFKDGVVIADESHFLKNPSSKRSKILVKAFRGVKCRAIMTGTPDIESELDMVQQMLFLDPLAIPALDYWSFRNNFCREEQFKWKLKPQHKKPFRKTIADRCYRLRKVDAGIKNEVISQTLLVQMPDALRKTYDGFEETFIMEVDGDIVVETTSAGARFAWLRSLASGMDHTGEVLWWFKFDFLLDLIAEQFEGKPLVIWAVHIAELKVIEQLLNEKYGADAAIRVDGTFAKQEQFERTDAWLAGKHDFLVANPTVLKLGADLSRSDTEIFFTTPASGETYTQAIERIWKFSSDRATFAIHICTADSVDEDLVDLVTKKEQRSHISANALRTIIERRRRERA